MNVKSVSIIVVTLLVLISALGMYAWKNLVFQPIIFTAKVVDIRDGSTVYLSTGDAVYLVGVKILTEGPNYRKELVDNINSILLNKNVKVKIICPKAKWQTYPELPLAEIYLENGTFVNELLLKTGMAFFDHGYYPRKDYYKNLEKNAKNEKIGIWKEKDKLKLMYVSSEYFWEIYYPDSPEVKNVKDKIEYYFKPPWISFYRGLTPEITENEK